MRIQRTHTTNHMIHYIDSYFHPEDTAESSLKRTLDDIFFNHTYSIVYVAFGGKYNEPHIEFKRPTINAGKMRRANYSQQIAPEFVRNKTGALSIVLDDFSNDELRECNMQIGHRIVDRVIHSNHHLDIVFYHRKIAATEFCSITQCLVNLFTQYQISPNNVVFANYIVYKQPNAIESETQTLVPSLIQPMLDKTPYVNCLYQWFGYQFYTYYLLYQYRQYSIWGTHNVFARTFESVFGDMPITTGSIPRLFYTNEWNDKKHIITHFLENVVDLCAYEHDNPSFREWIKTKSHSGKTDLFD